MKYATLLSGGMDSAVMLYYGQPVDQVAITVDYGQTHKREIEAARALCDRLDVKHIVVTVDGLRGGSLLDATDEMNGAATVVPYRNALLVMLAANIAVAEGCQFIRIGCNANDHETYPDCRSNYLRRLSQTLKHLYDVELSYPFIDRTKKEIRTNGGLLDVPFDLTWSCYRGGNEPCGECGACVEVQRSL